MNDIINIDDDKLNKNEKEYIDENTKTKIQKNVTRRKHRTYKMGLL